MTGKETYGLLALCEDFTALTREHRQFALTVFQGLLQTQEAPGFEIQREAVIPAGPGDWGVREGTD
jgi:hypothetical protein